MEVDGTVEMGDADRWMDELIWKSFVDEEPKWLAGSICRATAASATHGYDVPETGNPCKFPTGR